MALLIEPLDSVSLPFEILPHPSVCSNAYEVQATPQNQTGRTQERAEKAGQFLLASPEYVMEKRTFMSLRPLNNKKNNRRNRLTKGA